MSIELLRRTLISGPHQARQFLLLPTAASTSFSILTIRSLLEDRVQRWSICLGRTVTKGISSCAVPHSTSEPPRSQKPLVLVADDHAFILNAVSQLLATEFEVIAAVADGRSAVEAALRLDPDLVVLDLSMPELDGFGALRELRRLESRARAVFLTMHEGDDYVAAAVEAGAHGFVLKSRLLPDLVSALKHALAGRLFVPSLTSLLQIPDRRGKHAADFYTEEQS